MSSRAVTLATAGHIDHGKTALVSALTGKDTDRLEEEKRRGISIELGFALLETGSGPVSIVDVPGHERFVRTMISGAGGVDGFILVVACDDGVMPQTREHLVVLAALGVERGIVALTRADLAEPARRAEVRAEAEEVLPGAPVIEVSARTGEGLAALRAEVTELAAEAVASRGEGDPVPGEGLLHVDRSFSLPGQGTIVTGTLRSGTFERGERVTLLPGGAEARVRSIQTHDQPAQRAAAHSRVALNLAGVSTSEVEPGDVVAGAELALAPTYRIDVRPGPAMPAVSAWGPRVQVHHGTRDAPARVAELDDGLVQLRLERMLLPLAGERVVIRGIAPPDTLGGAVVVDAAPPRRSAGSVPAPQAGEWPEVAAAERPTPPDPPALDRDAARALVALRRDGVRPRSPADLASDLGMELAALEARLRALEGAGRAVAVGPALWFDSEVLARAEEEILDVARSRGSTSIAEVRDDLGTSRRCAQAILERLGSEKQLIRQGDRHLPRTGR